MKKIETIWQYLLLRALNDGVFRHTQQELAGRFRISLSTSHHALVTPTAIGAIRKESKFFVLADPVKLLYYWASVRNFRRLIIYQTYVNEHIQTIEGLAVPTSTFACYSAGRMILGETPADYAAVYYYDEKKNLGEIRKRFPPNAHKQANLFILENTGMTELSQHRTSLPLTFVDIWNLPDWYAKDFTGALEEHIHALLSRPGH
jgi:hypothetical protein